MTTSFIAIFSIGNFQRYTKFKVDMLTFDTQSNALVLTINMSCTFRASESYTLYIGCWMTRVCARMGIMAIFGCIQFNSNWINAIQFVSKTNPRLKRIVRNGIPLLVQSKLQRFFTLFAPKNQFRNSCQKPGDTSLLIFAAVAASWLFSTSSSRAFAWCELQ